MMKNYFIGFILVLISLFSFSSKANAWGENIPSVSPFPFSLEETKKRVGFNLNNPIYPFYDTNSNGSKRLNNIKKFIENKEYEKMGYKYYLISFTMYKDNEGGYLFLFNDIDVFKINIDADTLENSNSISNSGVNSFVISESDFDKYDFANYSYDKFFENLTLNDKNKGLIKLSGSNGYYYKVPLDISRIFNVDNIEDNGNQDMYYTNIPYFRWVNYFRKSYKVNTISFNDSDVLLNIDDILIYANPNDTYGDYKGYYFNDINFNYVPDFIPEGFKKVTLPAGYGSAVISGIKEGRIMWKSFQPHSRGTPYSYYDYSDRPWGSTEWPKLISQKKSIKFNEVSFTYQDFNLNDVEGSQFILFVKYDYIEGYDDFSFDLYIPENAYFSLVERTPNDQGGNDFDYDWQDPDTGDINHGSSSSGSGSNNNSFFKDFNNALDYFKDTVIGIFKEISYLFENLPIALKYFFMVIFVLILFVFLIRFIL